MKHKTQLLKMAELELYLKISQQFYFIYINVRSVIM